MNITLSLNNEIIKYGVCHIYSNSGLSTPVILSNGNGSGGNTITANVAGTIYLSASNCPSSIYCKIESNPLYNNSANFRLKTNQVSSISPSASARAIDMGFRSNIFVPTDAKCAIGYDLLTLGYRYSFDKITPINYTIPTGTSTDMVLYNKAFTYKAINSLDKTGYGSTTTRTTFGTYSSINATNMLNTTRGVNLTVPTLKLTSTNSLGALYKTWGSGFNQNYTIPCDNYDTTEGIIYNGKIGNNSIIVPSSTADGSYNIWESQNYYETNPAGKVISGCTTTYSTIANCFFLDTHWLPMCRFTIDSTSIFPEFASTSNGIKFNSPTQLRFTYKYPSGSGNTANNVYFKVCLCKINESGSAVDYYEPIYRYNYRANTSYLPATSENEIMFNFPTSISSSISFEQGATYIYFLRLIVDTPNDFSYMYFNFTTNSTYINHTLNTNVPEKVVTFANVNKNPLVPVYMALKSTIISCKLSYLQISYPNHSYSLGNSSKSLGKDTVTSQLKWLNANPAKIGLSTVSYANLYSGINVSAKNSMNSTRDIYSYTYIAIASPAVCYNGFTTTSWYKLQSKTSYITNNAFEGVLSITSTNIKFSINEILSGKHKLTEIYVRVDS